MTYTQTYDSPLGSILLAADEQGLTGLWFQDARHAAAGLPAARREEATPVLTAAKRWLDTYFAGRVPPEPPPLHLTGSSFRQQVWGLLLQIPYGQTVTYGALARQLAQARGGAVSARAVGGAVGRNPVSLMVPCHRVVGTGGSLTGYAGGLARKVWLLTMEGADMSRFFVPEKGPAR